MPSVMPTKEVAARRFWSKVDRSGGPNACWIWTRFLNPNGYGQVTAFGRGWLAHRLAWFLERGEELDASVFLCHRCDNRRCVNPGHLFTGDPSVNNQDCGAKGRSKFQRHPELARGENNGLSKLTAEQVRQIRARRANGELRKSLAAEFGITPQNVTHIVNGSTWRHV